MAKRQKWITLIVSLLMLVIGFIAGLSVKFAIKNSADAVGTQEVMSAEVTGDDLLVENTEQGNREILIRIDDGMVEWFDGSKWCQAASVEELQQQDKFYLAKEALEEFEQNYIEEKTEEQQETLTILEEEEIPLLVGEKEKPKEKPKKETPKTNTSSEQTTDTPVPTETPQPPADAGSSGGSTGGGNSSGGSTGGSTPEGGTPDSGSDSSTPDSSTPDSGTDSTPDSGSGDTAPTAPPAEDNSGDGENLD